MEVPTFQRIEVDQILNPKLQEDPPAFWLAQLRKADWQKLLKFAGVTPPASLKKCDLVLRVLECFEFMTCEGRGEVLQVWITMRHENQRGLVIQFRHSERDWSRGAPEFVDLEKNEPLGKVNIAGRLICKVN